jgi:hypothetical protein
MIADCLYRTLASLEGHHTGDELELAWLFPLCASSKIEFLNLEAYAEICFKKRIWSFLQARDNLKSSVTFNRSRINNVIKRIDESRFAPAIMVEPLKMVL